MVGVDGDFNDDWNYQIAVSYGRLDVHQDELNDLVLTDADGNFDGYLLAYDAVRKAYAGFKLSGNPEMSPVHRVRGGYLA